jgi:hypothetical protein
VPGVTLEGGGLHGSRAPSAHLPNWFSFHRNPWPTTTSNRATPIALAPPLLPSRSALMSTMVALGLVDGTGAPESHSRVAQPSM